MHIIEACNHSKSRHLLPYFALCLLVFTGCGGGGGGGNGGGGTGGATTSAIKATVQWAARSRTLNAPSSAMSMVAKLHNAAPDGGDFTFTVNRDASPLSYSSTYTSPTAAKTGAWSFVAEFHAQLNGAGDIVGSAAADVTIASDGTGIGDIATAGTVASVSVPANQTLPVGTHKDLAFEARTSSGSLLALSVGSTFFAVPGGSDKLSVTQDGIANGLLPGSASVTATVDGIVSPVQTVAVTSTATVAISPTAPTIYVTNTQTFTATVTNAATTGVTWQVTNSPTAGTISATGVYTAPNTAGDYTVSATSNYDPAKSTSTLVHVLANTVLVSPNPTDVNIGDQSQLSATVNGVANAPVTWSVQEGAAGGSVNASGLYTAPATAGIYHVVATSQAFPGVTGSSTVRVHAGDAHVIIH